MDSFDVNFDGVTYPLVATTQAGGQYDTESFIGGMLFGAAEQVMKLHSQFQPFTVSLPAAGVEVLTEAFPTWGLEGIVVDDVATVTLSPPVALDLLCPPNLVRQLDFAAMHRGWKITSETPNPDPEGPDGWVLLTLERVT